MRTASKVLARASVYATGKASKPWVPIDAPPKLDAATEHKHAQARRLQALKDAKRQNAKQRSRAKRACLESAAIPLVLRSLESTASPKPPPVPLAVIKMIETRNKEAS